VSRCGKKKIYGHRNESDENLSIQTIFLGTVPKKQSLFCNRNMEGAVPILTPELWTAVSQGQVGKVRQLLTEDVDVEEKGGPTASTPLHEAAMLYGSHGCQEMVRLLLEHGADVSVKNNDGVTPLHAVCKELDAMTNGLYWNYDGFGAVHLDQLEIVKLLLHHHADPSTKDNNENTPLHSAAWAGDTHAVDFLLNQGADTSAKNSTGHTPLHWTAGHIHDKQWHGHPHVARILLKRGVDVSDKGNDGNTSLHWAAESGHLLMVRLLLKQGADISAENNDGKTPIDVSTNRLYGPDWKHEEVTALLRAEETRQATWGAFMMGQHERLGAGSLINTIPPELAKMILDRV
jgi:ankyrin repeat protein